MSTPEQYAETKQMVRQAMQEEGVSAQALIQIDMEMAQQKAGLEMQLLREKEAAKLQLEREKQQAYFAMKQQEFEVEAQLKAMKVGAGITSNVEIKG